MFLVAQTSNLSFRCPDLLCFLQPKHTKPERIAIEYKIWLGPLPQAILMPPNRARRLTFLLVLGLVGLASGRRTRAKRCSFLTRIEQKRQSAPQTLPFVRAGTQIGILSCCFLIFFVSLHRRSKLTVKGLHMSARLGFHGTQSPHLPDGASASFNASYLCRDMHSTLPLCLQDFYFIHLSLCVRRTNTHTTTHHPLPPPHSTPVASISSASTMSKSAAGSNESIGKSIHAPGDHTHVSDTFYDHEGRLAKKSIRVGNMENDDHDRALER